MGWVCASSTLRGRMTFPIAMIAMIAISMIAINIIAMISTPTWSPGVGSDRRTHASTYNGSLRRWSSNGDRRYGQLGLSLPRELKGTQPIITYHSAGSRIKLSTIDTSYHSAGLQINLS